MTRATSHREPGGGPPPLSPPEPFELGQRIISDVVGEVRFDLKPVRKHLRKRLREPDDEYIWPRAERIAHEALDPVWPSKLEEQCRRGLAAAHDQALLQAERCLDALRDLETHRADSWIAEAVLHHFSFEAAWDVLSAGGSFLDDGCGDVLGGGEAGEPGGEGTGLRLC